MHDVSMAALKRLRRAQRALRPVEGRERRRSSDGRHGRGPEGQGARGSDQGALVVHVARDSDKAKVNPLIVAPRDGSAMYGATDVATILDRRNEQNPDLMLYVVEFSVRRITSNRCSGRPISRATPKKARSNTSVFALQNGPDGKPFRAGGVLKLGDLIEMATEKVRVCNEADLGSELPPEAFEDTAHKVAVAALKFADLSNYRGTSYVFDLDRSASKAGPAPTCSIKRCGSNPCCAKPPTKAPKSGPIVHRRTRRTRPCADPRRLRNRARRSLRQTRPQPPRRTRLSA